MNYPEISVITPTFNQGHFIEETIDSVLSQQYPALQYFIMDGGSTDNTREIIKKYEKHLAGWVSEKDKGQSDAINKGLKKISGEIVNWLNSDDSYTPGTLHKVAHYFSDPHILSVCGTSRVYGKEKEFIAPGTWVGKDIQSTINHLHVEQPATFFRKKATDKMGPVSEVLHFVMDKEWWLKYIMLFGISGVKKCDDVFVNFRLHEDSKTVSLSEKFNIDHATLVSNLLRQHDYSDLAEMAATKYPVNREYQFTIPVPSMVTAKMIERMGVSFLLKKTQMVYSENDFQVAKQFSQWLKHHPVHLDEREQQWKMKLDEMTKPANWFLFRLRRKIKGN
ncbi:MAG: glycosyltransferase family 2 protein [Bacteroidota bacterium]